MINLFKKLFSTDQEPEETIDVQSIIQQIKERETKQDISLGRRIHSSSYLNFDLFLDRDITKNYRITVFLGQDRIYSFSIFAEQGDYTILEKGYRQVITFLEGDRALKGLPDNEVIKGFFYGH